MSGASARRQRTSLSVLDLVPVSSGDTAETALRNSIDLAQRTEALGYERFWLAEHHLNPGNAGSASLPFLGVLAAATSRIRLGTAATLVGQTAPLPIAEAAGLIATLFGGRMDLGLGRTLGAPKTGESAPPAASAVGDRVVEGLLLPAPVRVDPTRGRFGLLAAQFPPAAGESFEDAVGRILGYLDGTFATPEGETVPVLPATGSGAAVWIHGSSGGESAQLAGRLGLPFGANYHSTPSTVLDAVAAYRSAFRPGRVDRPHVIVSVDVLIAESAAEAARIGAGFDRWVLSVRQGHGTLEYPEPASALAEPLTKAESALVSDRVRTRFVGDPATVAGHLEVLQRATGADELLVTTSAFAHTDRVRSYELLAEIW